MDNKQKEQMKKGLVFGGLGLLFVLSMWFIFAPSGKDKTAAEQGLNDSIPQATTEKPHWAGFRPMPALHPCIFALLLCLPR